jgi:hypothetical protein
MPVKLSTTIKKIENIPNITNRALLTEFHKYLNLNGVSESEYSQSNPDVMKSFYALIDDAMQNIC